MSSYSADHSHWNSFQSLGDWLKKHNVPALYGLDTRSLTKRIREHGAVLGKIELANQVWRQGRRGGRERRLRREKKPWSVLTACLFSCKSVLIREKLLSFLPRCGSLWLSMALSGSLRLSPALLSLSPASGCGSWSPK